MITKVELMNRVSDRKKELEQERAKLSEFQLRLSGFVSEIRSRSVIYNLIRNLTVWKNIEELIQAEAEREDR